MTNNVSTSRQQLSDVELCKHSQKLSVATAPFYRQTANVRAILHSYGHN